MHALLWVLVVLSLWGGWDGFRHEREGSRLRPASPSRPDRRVIRFHATPMLAASTSDGRCASSLARGDRRCEIAWIDAPELE